MASDREKILLHYANMIINICSARNLSNFDGFTPFIPDLYTEGYGIFTDVKVSDLCEKVNISLFKMGDPDDTKAKKEDQFIRLREVTSKELRKKCGVFAPKAYLLEVTFEKGSKPLIVPLTLRNGELRILESPNDPPVPNHIKVDIYNTIRTMMGMQFNLENQPRVYLKPEGAGIGFTLPIDNLAQLKELFSLREIPDGYKRRVALLHWVSKHLRRKPSKPEERVEVQKHLRGREDFEWFGIKGTIFNT